MSRKTTQVKRRVKQFSNKNAAGHGDLFPRQRVKSDGRKTIFMSADGVDDEGKPTKAGRRYPGRASGLIGTEPMKEEKITRLSRLVK